MEISSRTARSRSSASRTGASLRLLVAIRLRCPTHRPGPATRTRRLDAPRRTDVWTAPRSTIQSVERVSIGVPRGALTTRRPSRTAAISDRLNWRKKRICSRYESGSGTASAGSDTDAWAGTWPSLAGGRGASRAAIASVARQQARRAASHAAGSDAPRSLFARCRPRAVRWCWTDPAVRGRRATCWPVSPRARGRSWTGEIVAVEGSPLAGRQAGSSARAVRLKESIARVVAVERVSMRVALSSLGEQRELAVGLVHRRAAQRA